MSGVFASRTARRIRRTTRRIARRKESNGEKRKKRHPGLSERELTSGIIIQAAIS